MRKRQVIGAAAFALGLALSSSRPANAAVIIATFNGTVGSVGHIDDAGVFGSAGGNLQGDSFSIKLEYDPGTIAPTGTFDLENVLLLSDVVTVNGHSLSVVPPDTVHGSIQVQQTGPQNSFDINFPYFGAVSGATQLLVSGTDVPYSFGTPFSESGDTGNFGFEFDGVGANTTLDGALSSVIFSAVPEPATWALLVLGFGGIGAALRRQRSRDAVIA